MCVDIAVTVEAANGNLLNKIPQNICFKVLEALKAAQPVEDVKSVQKTLFRLVVMVVVVVVPWMVVVELVVIF